MKFLIVLALVSACVAAEDQQADDVQLYTSVAGYPHGLATYGVHPVGAYGYSSVAYHAPTVYSAYGAYPYAYGAHPYVHHLKKRDTVAAEDQQADEQLFYSSFAGGYPTVYGAYGLPHAYAGAYYRTARIGAPTVYSGYPYSYGRYFY